MTIDWNSMVSSACAIVSSMGAVGSAIMAKRALANWRSEMQGRTQFEIGRKMLVASRNIRDRFVFATSPSGKLYGEALTDLEARAKQLRERLRYRLNFLQEQMQVLEEAAVEVEVVCERKVEQHLQKLRSSISFIDLELMDSSNEERAPELNDPSLPDVFRALEALEEEVKPLLKAA
jgi:hypothetical protein